MMTLYTFLLVLLLALIGGGIASAQDNALLTSTAATDPLCQVTKYAPNDVSVYAAPDLNASVIGSMITDITYASNGFIALGNEYWYVVNDYEGSDGTTGFVWRRDVSVTANCPPALLPGITNPTPEPLRATPLIAYTSNRSGDYEIYLWDGEISVNISQNPGSNVTQAVWNSYSELAWYASDGENNDLFIWDGYQTINLDELLGQELAPISQPVWSADGRLTWSAATTLGGTEIFTWDGQQIVNISQHPNEDREPAWSADGRLAWVSYRDRDDPEVYVWDGQETINISRNPGNYDGNPTWSADGTMLAWGGVFGGNLELLVWDGERIINVSNDAGWDAWHMWSLDGRLAWVSTRDDYFTVYVWDGESSFRVGEIGFNEANPAWAPDGRLAWQSELDGTYDIKVWDGEQVINFTQTPDQNEYTPQWSKDGQMAWIVARPDNWDIYVWSGDEAVNISQSTGTDRYHVWAP